ncbi:MAG TPA: hypothetical protein VK731_12615 [Candidatus Cybelea sp.]|jgi:hypothetical protein|nr:hypothetical protein [Candidatus Cybelea sp.]
MGQVFIFCFALAASFREKGYKKEGLELLFFPGSLSGSSQKKERFSRSKARLSLLENPPSIT